MSFVDEYVLMDRANQHASHNQNKHLDKFIYGSFYLKLSFGFFYLDFFSREKCQ